MADGFNLILRDFCSYCGEFKLDIEKTEISTFGDSTERYITNIRCENDYKCCRLAERLKGN